VLTPDNASILSPEEVKWLRNSFPSPTSSSSSPSSRKRCSPAASSSPTPPRRSRTRARSSPSAPAAATTTASSSPWKISVGDRVLYAKYTGQEIKVENEEYIVLSERDILCKVQI